MLEYLKDIEEYDALFFMPHPEVDIHIQSNRYKNPGTPIDVGSVGPTWHVLLFKCNEETDTVENLDAFDAVLSDPREYISTLIPEGWFGIVAKKTTTSNSFISEALDKIKSMM